MEAMHTVALTRAFERAAADAGMSEHEIQVLVDFLAENPTAGDPMAGTGGCRKVRVAGRGKGKRGGYRTITFYTGENLPVFLITVFGKGEKSNLSKSERNRLRDITKAIVDEYRSKVATLARKGA
jgi:hypothetical protein